MKKILLLEDDESLNRGISLKLSKEGYQVLSCADPIEASKNSIHAQYEISPVIEFNNKEHPELEWAAVQKDNPLTEELKSGDKVIIDKNLLHWWPELQVGDVLDVTVEDNSIFNISNYHYPVQAAIVVAMVLLSVQFVLTLILQKATKKESLIDRIRFTN